MAGYPVKPTEICTIAAPSSDKNLGYKHQYVFAKPQNGDTEIVKV